ncbi:hypothetical protein Rai3103_00495 [Raineyella fluvialis]|uniref:Proteic killer suppression protein n=1 Tax=Raineyella fluvialis TaxID=2662261 RepID=A0A5Q2FAN0_9ACTN|nr:hypothetical protein Rai3103_00495 [Raineyella fluvialis]
MRAVDKRLERLANDDAARTKQLGAQAARRLLLRINELKSCSSEAELRAGPGNWHPVLHDWPGCLAGRVSGDFRIIVELMNDGEPYWLIKEIGHAYEH